MITIQKATTNKQLMQFVKFPFKLYKGCPYWVPPLTKDELETLDKTKNPVFKNAEAHYFLAYKKGNIVGRIAVILNHIEINEIDLRIDTYRASGAGGQHVNTTDSAVRITHIPSGIVVQCQSDRSQHKNKSNAMSMLKSKLYELELNKRKNEENKTNSEKKEIGWGHQIRSYVLHPYKMIKDLRTNYETSNVADVLDGKIDKFLEKSLTL